jgi:hypothetical protein
VSATGLESIKSGADALANLPNLSRVVTQDPPRFIDAIAPTRFSRRMPVSRAASALNAKSLGSEENDEPSIFLSCTLK